MGSAVIPIIGHAAFALTAVSFLFRDMLVLRALAIASGLIGIVYNYILPVGPLWIPIFWVSIFVMINAYRLIGIYIERRQVNFSDEELELYQTMFQNFSAVEFMKMMRIGTWHTVEAGYEFTHQGDVLDELTLIYNGEVEVEVNGEVVSHVRDGTLIGEISFIKGGPATATVTATTSGTGTCRYLVWSKTELQNLLRRNPTMDISMKTVFSMELIKKIGVEDTPASV